MGEKIICFPFQLLLFFYGEFSPPDALCWSVSSSLSDQQLSVGGGVGEKKSGGKKNSLKITFWSRSGNSVTRRIEITPQCLDCEITLGGSLPFSLVKGANYSCLICNHKATASTWLLEVYRCKSIVRRTVWVRSGNHVLLTTVARLVTNNDDTGFLTKTLT